MTDTATPAAPPTPPTPLTERGRRTREALVAAARRVFAERGYSGTRMQDVAAEAGVSHGTVYTWFASKDELLREVAHAIVGEVFAAARDPRDAPDDPYLRLLAANARFLVGYRRHARMLAVVEEAASTDPRWEGLLDDLRETYVGRTRRSLRRLADEGLIAGDVDPEVAAPALTGMVETFARRTAATAATTGSLAEDAEQITRLWGRAVGLAVPPTSTRTSTPTSTPAPATPGEDRP